MTDKPLELAWYISQLEDMANTLDDVPDWDGILLTEGFIARNDNQQINRGNLYEPDFFITRFDEVVASGHSWVNLSFVGVLEGKLLISLEDVSSSIIEGCSTSVNLSGPLNLIRSRHGWNLDNITIIE